MEEETQSTGKPLVLLVEDDKFLCEIFSRKAGNVFNVIATSSGKEALEIAKTKRPDVILLDLNLPDGNGFDILKKIRSDKELGDTLVLILTNSVLSEDAIRSNELRADDFLTKANFSMDDIIARMEDHLSKKALQDKVA